MKKEIMQTIRFTLFFMMCILALIVIMQTPITLIPLIMGFYLAIMLKEIGENN